MKVFLIGFMGSGKSTVGKKIAKQLRLPFVDLDHYIEEQEQSTITQIFQDKGEAVFRKIESDALVQLCSQKENMVLSLGGGTPCVDANMQVIKKNGVSVYLSQPKGVLLDRLKNGKAKRPLIAAMSDAELDKFIDAKLVEREKYYLQADIQYEGKDLNAARIESLAKRIATYVK